jgi:hypothetical protein
LIEPHRQLEQALSETACRIGPTPAGLAGHDVHFYKNEDHLTKVVVDYLAEGLRAGQPIVVIASKARRERFAAGLRERNLDPDELLSGRLAIWLDARETLDTFFEGGKPDRELFMATVGRVFERLLDKHYYLVVRAYGEMVDLLWQEGNHEAAIVVEQYWNDLANLYRYSLLCGYSIKEFEDEARKEGFSKVCGCHSRAFPIEADRHVA